LIACSDEPKGHSYILTEWHRCKHCESHASNPLQDDASDGIKQPRRDLELMVDLLIKKKKEKGKKSSPTRRNRFCYVEMESAPGGL
jgi:hypothetical protein